MNLVWILPVWAWDQTTCVENPDPLLALWSLGQLLFSSENCVVMRTICINWWKVLSLELEVQQTHNKYYCFPLIQSNQYEHQLTNCSLIQWLSYFVTFKSLGSFFKTIDMKTIPDTNWIIIVVFKAPPGYFSVQYVKGMGVLIPRIPFWGDYWDSHLGSIASSFLLSSSGKCWRSQHYFTKCCGFSCLYSLLCLLKSPFDSYLDPVQVGA